MDYYDVNLDRCPECGDNTLSPSFMGYSCTSCDYVEVDEDCYDADSDPIPWIHDSAEDYIELDE